jgi:hypothetical protein
MMIFQRWYFGFVLKLEISYYRVMISWKILVSCREFKKKKRLYFCMVKLCEFPWFVSFALRYPFLFVKWQGHSCVHTPPLLFYIQTYYLFFGVLPDIATKVNHCIQKKYDEVALLNWPMSNGPLKQHQKLFTCCKM